MDKLKALWALFKAGQSVADPGKWKSHQITATLVGALLMALVNCYKAITGHDFPLDPDTANTVGAGAIALVNVVLTLITSKTIGLDGMQPHGVPESDPVPSPAPAAATAPEALPELPRATPVPRIDDATRQRAVDYVRRAGNPSDPDFQAP